MTDITAFASELLTVSDAALMLQCPVSHVRRLRANGVLSAFYVGTQPMFRWAEVRSVKRAGERVASTRPAVRSRVFGSGVQRRRVVAPIASDTAILSDDCPSLT